MGTHFRPVKRTEHLVGPLGFCNIDLGTLYYAWESENGQNKHLQIVVPRYSIPRVLDSFHDQVSVGHLEATKTAAKLWEWFFYWPTYKYDVRDRIRRCITCAATKGPQTRWQGKLQKYNVGHPFERIAMDLAGPFPMSQRGNHHILVVADYFSKWCEAYPAPHRCPWNSQSFCGKLDLTLWCSIRAAHGLKKELRIKPVLGDVQGVED